ncbi:type VII secretion-associated protein [Mycolicibacterium litorale]|nr:type VII secretion-associated protein [Mycolicibacterium litorale]
MLVNDRPAAVRTVMTELLRSAAGPGDGGLTVVHPSWWSRRRVEVVLEASTGIDAEVITRAELFGDGLTPVVEIAAEHVAVVSTGVCTITRTTDDAVCTAVVREIGHAPSAVVDAPPGVGGDALAAAIIAALGERGVTATRAGPPVARVTDRPAPERRRRRTGPLLAGALVTTVCVGAAAITYDGTPAPAEPTALLVEGRVGVIVPALWTVQRVTEGSGSARVQITSPTDHAVALHLTQSVLPRPQPLEEVADTLRDALQAEDADVFTDFRAVDERGGRAVATYQERRAKHQTEWAVLVDNALRIAIGCQHPIGGADPIRPVCETAVRSTHAVF